MNKTITDIDISDCNIGPAGMYLLSFSIRSSVFINYYLENYKISIM